MVLMRCLDAAFRDDRSAAIMGRQVFVQAFHASDARPSRTSAERGRKT